jgi:hypothetical protein
MPRGASKKREREYEALKDRFEKEGRYPGRGTEVAARIVNKQRRQYGETRGEREKDRAGESPDRGLPIADYQELTVPQIKRRIGRLSKPELRRIREYELHHKNRRSLLQELDRRL